MYQLLKSILFISLLSVSAFGFTQDQPTSININTATVEDFAQTMKGVGLKKAERIVAYRESQGDFTSVSELANVKGIGVSIIEKNLASLRLE